VSLTIVPGAPFLLLCLWHCFVVCASPASETSLRRSCSTSFPCMGDGSPFLLRVWHSRLTARLRALSHRCVCGGDEIFDGTAYALPLVVAMTTVASLIPSELHARLLLSQCDKAVTESDQSGSSHCLCRMHHTRFDSRAVVEHELWGCACSRGRGRARRPTRAPHVHAKAKRIRKAGTCERSRSIDVATATPEQHESD
jgi:hypothetical protein